MRSRTRPLVGWKRAGGPSSRTARGHCPHGTASLQVVSEWGRQHRRAVLPWWVLDFSSGNSVCKRKGGSNRTLLAAGLTPGAALWLLALCSGPQAEEGWQRAVWGGAL